METLGANDPARMAEFRREFESSIRDYFGENVIRQDFLMTRATKL